MLLNRGEEKVLDVETFLAHYGVKGMKWGIRKKRAYNFLVREDSFLLKKGSNIHRMTTNKNEENKGHAYASFTEKDVRHYQKSVVSWITEAANAGEEVAVFDMTMKVKKDLISPSEKTKVKTFIKLMEDPNIQEEIMKSTERTIDTDQKEFRFVKLSKKVQDLGLPPDVANIYSAFSMGLYPSSKLRDSFFSELKSKGYNMIIDTEDSLLEAEAPIIVFDRADTLKTLRVTKLPKKYSPEWYNLVDQVDKDEKK
jgi:hypothetical protein